MARLGLGLDLDGCFVVARQADVGVPSWLAEGLFDRDIQPGDPTVDTRPQSESIVSGEYSNAHASKRTYRLCQKRRNKLPQYAIATAPLA